MDKNTKICIIGAGPAGLSAGMYLEQKGYENYTILERNDHVGGKCHSPHYNGRRYEMGAIMGVPSYYAVHDVEEFCGITHDGPQLNRNYKDKTGKVIEPFEPKNIMKIPRLLKMKQEVKKLGEIHSVLIINDPDCFSMSAAPADILIRWCTGFFRSICVPYFCFQHSIKLIEEFLKSPEASACKIYFFHFLVHFLESKSVINKYYMYSAFML
jgi:hypothetical protein